MEVFFMTMNFSQSFSAAVVLTFAPVGTTAVKKVKGEGSGEGNGERDGEGYGEGNYEGNGAGKGEGNDEGNSKGNGEVVSDASERKL